MVLVCEKEEGGRKGAESKKKKKEKKKRVTRGEVESRINENASENRRYSKQEEMAPEGKTNTS